MRLKRAIKKIVALGTGATMVGATILGAMAQADLADYPQPFIQDGAFNGLIVVGSEAKTEDVLGSIDIATSLQYSATVTKPVPGTGTTVDIEGEGVKIATDSNDLTVGESLQSVKSDLDEEDLPTLLAEGVFVNDGDDESTEYEYEQKLEFGPSDNATVTFLKDRDYVDEDNPYLMLYSPKGGSNWFMQYTLDFTKNAESDVSASSTGCGSTNEMCDIEDTKLEMLGVEYDITKAEWDSTANEVTWEMMGGVTLNSMYEGETKTFTVNGVDYEVTVDIISDTGSDETVILSVNGESTKELAKDQTATVAGIEIGIKQVMGNEAGEAGAGRDLVQFYLGAEKVVLTDEEATGATSLRGTKVKVGGDTVDELYADWYVSSGSSTVTLQKLVLTWVPEDDIFETEEVSTEFPGPGQFEVTYEGLTSSGNEETVVFEPHGDDNLQLTVPIEAGSTTFDVLFSDGTNFTGFGETATNGNGRLITSATTVYAGDYILLNSSAERETRVVEFDDVSTENVTTLKDLSTGTKYEKSCGASTCTINVGDLSAVFSSVSSSGSESGVLTAASDLGGGIYTKEGLTIDLGTAPTNSNTHVFTVLEEDQNGVLAGGNSFTVRAAVSSGKTTMDTVTNVNAFEDVVGTSGPSFEMGDSEEYAYYTQFGTKVVWDKSGDEYSVEVTYPGAEAHANVFVNAESAVITEGGGGGTYDEVQRIEVGAAVLDTEVADLEDQNTIVVGGPCVNTLAAELMDNPADCAEGFEMGKAMVKLFEHDNGNVALLVAGYNAMDTRRASRVVANHDDYENLEGTEVEVTGTSLTEISVSAPSPEEAEEEVEEEAEEESEEETEE